MVLIFGNWLALHALLVYDKTLVLLPGLFAVLEIGIAQSAVAAGQQKAPETSDTYAPVLQISLHGLP